MNNTSTVNLDQPSLYAEPDGFFYRFKRKVTYNNILRLIDKYLIKKTNFSLLEIGTGSGFLMTFLEKKYPLSNLKGLEYDPRLVELTQKKLTRTEIIQGNAEDFSFEEKFDMIVSLQVIEHLYHPKSMLDCVRKSLKENGIFILTTPNLGCTSEKVMKDKWHGYREDHVSLKDCDGWDAFLIENGFKKIYSGSTFFTGIPVLNKFPLGLLNWSLLFFLGSLKWKKGESYIGVFTLK